MLVSHALAQSDDNPVFTSSGNAHGSVDVHGVCSCAAFYSGDRCEIQYTDAITCSEAGTVDTTGTCFCTAGVGVRCYNDAVTCTWMLACHPPHCSVLHAALCASFATRPWHMCSWFKMSMRAFEFDRRRFTSSGNAHGTVNVEGVCSCATSHIGDRCEAPVGGEGGGEGGGGDEGAEGGGGEEGAAESTYGGAFALLGSFDTTLAYIGMAGTAELVIDASGIRTSLQVTAANADLAGTTFEAHLHAAPCSAGGGGHYQDPGNPGVVDAVSEHWPELACTAATGEGGAAEGGEQDAVAVSCVGAAASRWKPTAAEIAAGLSIVVHDTPRATTGPGSKMMCADLDPVPSGPTQADSAWSDSEEAPLGAIVGAIVGVIAVDGVAVVVAKRKGEDGSGPRKNAAHENASYEAKAGGTDGFGFASSSPSPGDDGYLEVNSIK